MAQRRRTKKQLNKLADDIESKAFTLYSQGVLTMQALDTISKAMDRVRVKIKNK